VISIGNINNENIFSPKVVKNYTFNNGEPFGINAFKNQKYILLANGNGGLAILDNSSPTNLVLYS
jgi:hypothetical protein